MSFERITKTQGPHSLETESGNLQLNPQGVIVMAKEVQFSETTETQKNLNLEPGVDVQAFDNKLKTIADLSPGSGEDGKVLSWNNAGAAFELVTDATVTYSAGDGIVLNSGEFALDPTVGGNGLAYASGVLSVGVDDSTVELSGDAVRVKAGGISATELATGSVTSVKIANDSIGSQHYVAGSVDESALGTDAVTTAKILNGQVTVEKLASDSVVEAKILNEAVSTAKIADGAITSAKVSTGIELTAPNFASGVSHLTGDSDAFAQTHARHFQTTSTTTTNPSLVSLADGSRCMVELRAVAKDAVNGDTGCYVAKFAAKWEGGVASILGSTNVEVVYEDAGASAWSFDTIVSGSAVQYALTGGSNTVDWSIMEHRVIVA